MTEFQVWAVEFLPSDGRGTRPEDCYALYVLGERVGTFGSRALAERFAEWSSALLERLATEHLIEILDRG